MASASARDRKGCALVIGGSGGIGAACAKTLARHGDSVAFSYRSSQAVAQNLLAELGGDTQAWSLDLLDEQAVAVVIEEVAHRYSGIHTLVYAAGPHVPQIHLSRVSPSQFRQHLLDEAAAFFNVAHAALLHLRASQGSIVAVTTAATDRYPQRDGLSASAKGAIEQTVKALAAEEGRYGVRVNAVGPGMLTDGMAARLMASGDLDEEALAVTRRNIPLGRFGSAQDIAEAVSFLASPAAGFITGQVLNVDGGYSV
ncbi:MAG: SDR family oxidoreductase [Actinobacteria bacterium]|nr:SDR family oxidoreductase [Actinomycetota bacterium]